MAPENVSAILTRAQERLMREGTPERASTLLFLMQTLLGLRYNRPQIEELMGKMLTQEQLLELRENSLFLVGEEDGRKVGLREGEQQGKLNTTRKMVLRLGHKRLGEPQSQIVDSIRNCDDTEFLGALLLRIADVENWGDLYQNGAFLPLPTE